MKKEKLIKLRQDLENPSLFNKFEGFIKKHESLKHDIFSCLYLFFQENQTNKKENDMFLRYMLGRKKEEKRTLERRYKFEGTKKWKKDTDLPLWPGQDINEVISSMKDGTNFKLVSYKTKRINSKRIRIDCIIQEVRK